MPADFAQLYNAHRKRVSEMSDEELEKTRQEAADIAHNARIITLAATEETNERKAKKGKVWNVPANDANIGDVETRKKRMSAADKVAATLKNLGIANAQDILASIGKGTVAPTVRVDLNSIEIKEKKTFDPASLKFGK